MNKNIELGCCIFTVAEEFKKAPYKTLQKLAEIGYTTIETGDFNTLDVSGWQSMCKKAGLKIACTHFLMEQQENNPEKMIEFSRILGSQYIGCPLMRNILYAGEDDYLREAEAMNRLGKVYADYGIKFIYHNHHFEFKKFNGKYGLDILRENTDPCLVGFELDTYWIARGGESPEDYIRQFVGRVDIVHFKDITDDGFFAPVGEGTLDIEVIVKASIDSGAKSALVEQDEHRKPAFECAESSFNYLSRLY